MISIQSFCLTFTSNIIAFTLFQTSTYNGPKFKEKLLDTPCNYYLEVVQISISKTC